MNAKAEFARPVRLDTLGSANRAIRIEADADERAALTRRFALSEIESLSADLMLVRDSDGVTVAGRMNGRAVQHCVATGEPVRAAVDEPVRLRFVPAKSAAGGEIELDADALDTIEHDGQTIDIGEAIAGSFALALDPFPRAADADERLRAAGVLREGDEKRGALADLGALLKKG